MKPQEVQLTLIDKMILQSYRSMVEGLGNYLGEAYEICLLYTSRYAFLKAFDAMCEQYDFTFLKGAGSKVDQNIREFVAMHGKEALLQVAKLHFANTKKALG